MAAPIKSVHFQNYKVLRDSTLPLGQFTLLIGPNGSGKSTALNALRLFDIDPKTCLSAGLSYEEGAKAQVRIDWAIGSGPAPYSTRDVTHSRRGGSTIEHHSDPRRHAPPDDAKRFTRYLKDAAIYNFDAKALAQPVRLQPKVELSTAGQGFAVVLDRLRDQHPERFEALNREFCSWLPEFDHILFDTPATGTRAIMLRTRRGGHAIHAPDISRGTLLALAILTLAYLPEPPPVVGLEEPGRGIHPRLLRRVKDAIYRLTYPDQFGENREAVQVVATTHSPYMVDLFKEHPEEIVLAEKTEDNVVFRRLSDVENVEKILEDASLGDVWYSGILGGVPAGQ
ncbi:MAG: AAA family ATPase [Planctomycetota bacterium]